MNTSPRIARPWIDDEVDERDVDELSYGYQLWLSQQGLNDDSFLEDDYSEESDANSVCSDDDIFCSDDE